MKKKLLSSLFSKALFGFFLLSIPAGSFAQAVGDYGSAANGNWGTDGTNWVVCATAGQWTDATPASGAPTATTNVWIRAGHTITAEATGKTCKNLVVEAGATAGSGGTLITSAASGTNNVVISGTLAIQANANYQLGGTSSNFGTAWTNVTLDNASTVEFTGSQTSMPISTSGTITFGNLVWSASTVSLCTSSATLILVVNGNLTINKTASTSGKIRGATTNFAGTATHTVYGDLIMNNSSASNHCLSLINSAPSPGSVTFDVKGNVYLNSGRITMLESSGSTNPTAILNIGGNLTIGSAAILQYGSNAANAGTSTINVKGNIINNNTSTSSTGAGIIKNSGGGGSFTINMNGTVAQLWTGLFPVTFTSTTSNININNSNGVILNTSNTVGNTLTLSSGKLSIGANNLIIPTTAVLSGGSSSSYIITDGVGKLTLNATAATPKLFPIGASASSYDPVTVTPTSASDFTVGVSSTLSGSPAYGVRYNAKEWSIASSAPSATVVALTPSSVVESSDPLIGVYNNSAYSNTAATLSGSTFSTTVSTFGSFVTGSNVITTDIAAIGGKTTVAASHNQITVQNTKAGDTIAIYTINGQLVKKLTVVGIQNSYTFPSGIYLVKVNNTTTKIVL